MSTFLSSATLAALDRYHVATRRARRVTALSVYLWFLSPIGGAPFVLAAFAVSLVALGLSDHADGIKPGVPCMEVLR